MSSNITMGDTTNSLQELQTCAGIYGQRPYETRRVHDVLQPHYNERSCYMYCIGFQRGYNTLSQYLIGIKSILDRNSWKNIRLSAPNGGLMFLNRFAWSLFFLWFTTLFQIAYQTESKIFLRQTKCRRSRSLPPKRSDDKNNKLNLFKSGQSVVAHGDGIILEIRFKRP